MPGLNRKGPNNEGPMTGNKEGLCNPKNNEKDLTPENERSRRRNKDAKDPGLGRKKRGLGLRLRKRRSRP